MDSRQMNLFHAALSKNPPFMTNDPIVNHAVDQHMEDRKIPYDENLYLKEIEAWKNSGCKLLTFV